MAIILPFLLAAAAAGDPLVIEHVTLVDARTATTMADQVVVIRGDRIEQVGGRPPAKVSKRIDGRGKYLIPGLWDMHVHLTGVEPEWPRLFLATGVTGARETAAGMAEFARLRKLREEATSGRTLVPELALTAEGIDALGPGKPAPFGVRSAADARRAVEKLREIGAEFVKIGGGVPRPAYLAVSQECLRLKLPFVGHVPYGMTPQEVSDAGQISIEHLDGLLLACSSAEERIRAAMASGQPPPVEMIASTFDAAKAAALAARLRRNGTWVCPTLASQAYDSRGDDPSVDRDPRLRYVRPAYRANWAARRRTVKHREAGKLLDAQLALTGILWRGGVRILAGADTPSPYCVPGFAIHDELKLLVRARLTPAAALAAATIGPAEFLERSGSIGTIEAGKLANLILLEENPLSEIGNTEKISAVVIRGRVLARRELERMLKRIAAELRARSGS